MADGGIGDGIKPVGLIAAATAFHVGESETPRAGARLRLASHDSPGAERTTWTCAGTEVFPGRSCRQGLQVDTIPPGHDPDG